MGASSQGKFDRDEAVTKIMHFFERRRDAPRWSTKRRKFDEVRANKFFIGVMLDQLQTADRAWEGADYLVENYFTETGDFWREIEDTNLSTIKKICRQGFEGQAFALGVKVNSFPKQLKAAAKRIVAEYDSDVRNVWNKIDKENVDEIYGRFRKFEGIGDALAKMAQFILVRDYGVAGGRKSKKFMSVKPDVHVQRVLFRMGFSESETAKSVVDSTNVLNLRSPADFDWAEWKIGQLYCHSNSPNCGCCPLGAVCDRNY